LVFIIWGEGSTKQSQGESEMNTTTVAVDLAKDVFQLAVADADWRVVHTARLSRSQFAAWFQNHAVSRVIMEACGSAHHWARWLTSLGIEVTLLPAAYVRAYVKRNKTDAADAAALLEAARCADITPVQIKSVEQQALQGLHRIRSLWMGTRTSRINALRGFCREFGIAIAVGSRTGVENIARVLADPNSAVPEMIRGTMKLMVEEIRLMEARIAQIERELTQVAKHSDACKLLLSIPGVGLLTSTAMVAATSGKVTHFKDARHFASWFGLTPKEYSSGNCRRLGRISKKGDRYLRMLLTHGARSVLRSAVVARTRGQAPGGVRAWALAVQARTNHNKAACALANKMARICYAVMRDGAPFGQPVVRLSKKINRQAFEMAA
jgi:transposase